MFGAKNRCVGDCPKIIDNRNCEKTFKRLWLFNISHSPEGKGCLPDCDGRVNRVITDACDRLLGE